MRLIPPSPQASPEFETPARSSLLLPMTAGLVSEPKPSETNATTAGVLCRRSLLACRPTHSLPFPLLRDERERKTQRCIVSCNVFRRSQHLRPCCRSTLDQSAVDRLRQAPKTITVITAASSAVPIAPLCCSDRRWLSAERAFSTLTLGIGFLVPLLSI